MKKIQLTRLVVQIFFILLTILGVLVNLPITMIIIMIISVIGGAFYCGWLCPFGTLQDIMSKLAMNLNIEQHKMPSSIQKYLKYSRYIFAGLVMVLTTDFIFTIITFDPRNTFITLITGQVVSVALLMVLFSFVIISLFFKRPFCNYFCTEGAKYGLFSSFRLFSIKRNEDTCIRCNKCNNACPMQITITDVSVVQSLQCINCMECIATCPIKDTMTYGQRFEKKKIVRWITLASSGLLVLVTSLFLFTMIKSNAIESLNNNNKIEESISTSTIISINNDTNSTTENEIATLDEVTDNQSSETLSEAVEELGSGYKDGVYTGTGTGFRGRITVEVTVANGDIKSIEVIESRDDRKWYNRAVKVISDIITSQTTDVDTISGATFSSRGIIEATADALQTAK